LSLKYKALVGALWTVGTSIGGRALGLVGTLILTRFLAPEAYGEVSIATVIVMIVNAFVALGFGQYVVANPKAGRDVGFHATFFHVALGTVVLAGLLVIGPFLGPVFDAPNLNDFLLGLVAATWIERLAYMPTRILARDMRFSVLGAKLLVGEIAYAGVAVGLAAAGLGAMAVMWGYLARHVIGALVVFVAVDWRDWIEPHRLSRETTRKMLDFGIPMYFAHVMHFVSMRGDNLVIGGVFGPAAAGEYNLAYNLADIPASQVGEHIGDVLLPSFAKMDNDVWRRKALVRAAGLLALVVFPLAVGLAAIADSLVRAIFDPRWYRIAPMLVLLSMLSIFRPVGWLVAAYLQAMQRTRTLFVLEAIKTVGILGFVYLLGQIGILYACAGVGLGFAVNAFASVWAIYRADGLPMTKLILPLLPPLFASLLMGAAVFGLRAAIGARLSPWPATGVEIMVGAVVYVAAAFLVAPKLSREIVDLFVGLVKRKRASTAASMGQGADAVADAADEVPEHEEPDAGQESRHE
jgi:lipopolysaccharide exporter